MLSFLPKYLFNKLTDINPDFFKANGFNLVLLDFDNTMLPYIVDQPTPELLSWIDIVKSNGITLCIVTNSKKKRVPQFSEKYDLDCITNAKKPGTAGIRTALNLHKCPKKNTCLIGDQIFTDVMGANIAGITSIHVKSINNHNFWLKLRHLFEIPFINYAVRRKQYEKY